MHVYYYSLYRKCFFASKHDTLILLSRKQSNVYIILNHRKTDFYRNNTVCEIVLSVTHSNSYWSGAEGNIPNCCWINKARVFNCFANNACSLISAIAFFSRIFSSCDSWLCVEHFTTSWPSTVTMRPRQPILWYSEHRQNTLCPDCRSVLYIKPLWTSWYLPLELMMSCGLPTIEMGKELCSAHTNTYVYI